MELEFVIENTTPLFIAGADKQNISREGLRPPSVKGMIREWFRTLLGGITYELSRFSYQKLLLDERRILGSPQNASFVKIRSFPLETEVREFSSTSSFGPNVDYLFYSMKGGGANPGRSYFIPGSRFRLEIDMPPAIYQKQDPLIFQSIASALWAGLYLGGVGSRIRRGGGNFRVIEGPDPEQCGGIDFCLKTAGRAEFGSFLQKNLGRIREIYHELTQLLGLAQESKGYTIPPMMLLAPGSTSIFLGPEMPTWEEALGYCSVLLVGDRSKEGTQSSLREDVRGRSFISTLFSVLNRDAPVTALQGVLWDEMRALLGMPLNFFFKPIKKRATLGNRWPSPLWVGLGGSGPFVPRITLFKIVSPEAQEKRSLSLPLNLGRDFGRPVIIQLPGKDKQLNVLESLEKKLSNQMTAISIK